MTSRQTAAAGAAFAVLFAAGLFTLTPPDLDAAERAGGGAAARVTASAGAVGATLLCVGAAAFATPAMGMTFGDAPLPSGALLRVADTAAYEVIAVFAMPALGLSIGAAAVGGLRAQLLPRALAWSGIALAVALLASFVWLPMVALIAWTLVAAAVLARRPLRIPLTT